MCSDGVRHIAASHRDEDLEEAGEASDGGVRERLFAGGDGRVRGRRDCLRFGFSVSGHDLVDLVDDRDGSNVGRVGEEGLVGQSITLSGFVTLIWL